MPNRRNAFEYARFKEKLYLWRPCSERVAARTDAAFSAMVRAPPINGTPEWFEVNAMTLSTSDPEGGSCSRIVLLKGIESDGFLFFTNYNSAKGREIAVEPNVALHFFWPMFDRQVRIEGLVVKTSSAISDQYFASRPRSSQLGSAASPQSQILLDDLQLDIAIQELDNKYAGQPIPRPDNWGGYKVIPHMIEFWQGKPSRLHDRFRYDRTESGEAWSLHRLAP